MSVRDVDSGQFRKRIGSEFVREVSWLCFGCVLCVCVHYGVFGVRAS